MTKTLKFAPDLVPLVLSREKTSTWRLFDDKELTEGDILEFLNSDTKEHFSMARVLKVVEKPLGTLTEEDKEGHEKFASDEEMYKTYEKYYNKKVTPETLIKLVYFELIP